MRFQYIFIAIGAVLSFPGRALAEPKDKCNGVEGIAQADLADCNEQVYNRCRPSYQTLCVQRIQTQFRRKAVDEAAAAERSRGRGDQSVCESSTFVTACEKAKAYHKDVCSQTGALSPEAGQVNETWRERFRQAPEIKKYWEDFAARYPQCNLSKFPCSFSEFERDECVGLEKTYREKWSEWYGWLTRSEMTNAREQFAKFQKKPLDFTARHIFDREEKLVAEARTFAAFDYLGVDVAALEAWSAEIAKEKRSWEQRREEALAKIQCPAAKNKDKKMTKLLSDVLLEQDKKVKDPSSTLKETMVVFGLSGGPRQTREVLAHTLHEDMPGFSCVRQEKEGVTTCRIFDFTFRRSKPDGGGWGSWGVYSVGGGTEMSCANLK